MYIIHNILLKINIKLTFLTKYKSPTENRQRDTLCGKKMLHFISFALLLLTYCFFEIIIYSVMSIFIHCLKGVLYV